jgi:hypothetical protein
MAERSYYGKYIRKLDYSPTIEEKLPFSGSDESKEDLSEPTAKKARPIPFQQRFSDHISENYISWIIGIVVIIFVFLMYGAKIDISDIKIHIDIIRGDVTELKGLTKENAEKSHKHDMELQKNSIHIKSLKEEMKKLQSQ